MSQIAKLLKEKGELPCHSGIGGYPLYYVTEKGETYCGECATKLYKEDKNKYFYPPQVNWESEIYCDECSRQIESAY